MYYNFIGFNFGLAVLVLLVFGILQWLHIPTGSFIDWVIAVAIFEWLLAIVTVPWNIHFEAKEVLADAAQSTEKEIAVDAKQVEYAKVVAKRSLFIAIALHILSAIGLYALAIAGISAVGYISSGAALLLTALRPAVRTYEYLAARLAMIRQEFKYPREDIMELRSRFTTLEETVKRLEEQMNPEQPDSWIAAQQRYKEETRKELARLAASFEELRATNKLEHERLSREARQAIAQLTTDGQFLDHVREIIRFFKTA
ncbi:MAG: hypothetical protein KME08_09565 [Aphanothece sp. CMT-3BRIN-NPC111]|jgi:septal ring factor EnvC (AmiA/AmiB activator)|nr:hypothetical protein [Aphanothece sp. CMT-3BRIN-NPC111]